MGKQGGKTLKNNTFVFLLKKSNIVLNVFKKK